MLIKRLNSRKYIYIYSIQCIALTLSIKMITTDVKKLVTNYCENAIKALWEAEISPASHKLNHTVN